MTASMSMNDDDVHYRHRLLNCNSRDGLTRRTSKEMKARYTPPLWLSFPPNLGMAKLQ